MNKNGILYRHEQLQDMGQNIALEIPMNWFIWNPKECKFIFANEWGFQHVLIQSSILLVLCQNSKWNHKF
jgi:hypothetical protein